MNKVLITGASGSLGRALVEYLTQTNRFEVHTIGRQNHNYPSHIECDVNDHARIGSILKEIKPDILVHSAAIFSGSFSEMLRTNVLSSKNILDLVHDCKLRTRVILIGSAAEYGAIKLQDNPVREVRALAPISDYGTSKAFQSQLISLYASRGIDVVGTRIFNLYGAGVSQRLFAGRVQNQIEDLLAGKTSSIEVGSLSAVRDYISTQEAAEQLTAVIEHGITGEVYHIASGVPITMRHLLERQLSAAGLNWSVVREMSSKSNHTGFDVPAIYADNSKVIALLASNRLSA